MSLLRYGVSERPLGSLPNPIRGTSTARFAISASLGHRRQGASELVCDRQRPTYSELMCREVLVLKNLRASGDVRSRSAEQRELERVVGNLLQKHSSRSSETVLEKPSTFETSLERSANRYRSGDRRPQAPLRLPRPNGLGPPRRAAVRIVTRPQSLFFHTKVSRVFATRRFFETRLYARSLALENRDCEPRNDDCVGRPPASRAPLGQISARRFQTAQSESPRMMAFASLSASAFEKDRLKEGNERFFLKSRKVPRRARRAQSRDRVSVSI